MPTLGKEIVAVPPAPRVIALVPVKPAPALMFKTVLPCTALPEEEPYKTESVRSWDKSPPPVRPVPEEILRDVVTKLFGKLKVWTLLLEVMVKVEELEVVTKVWTEPVWPFKLTKALPPTMVEEEIQDKLPELSTLKYLLPPLIVVGQ